MKLAETLRSLVVVLFLVPMLTFAQTNTWYVGSASGTALASAVSSANASNGVVYMTVPGNYVLNNTTGTLTLGAAAPSTRTSVHLYMGPSTTITCSMTSGPCITINDGSGLHGLPGYTLSALSTGNNPVITLSSSAVVTDVVTNAAHGGSSPQESMSVDGITFVGNSTQTISGAMLH